MSKENDEQLNEDGTPKEEKSELRQDDISNDMTRKILERNNVKTVAQDVKTVDSEKKDADTVADPAKKTDVNEQASKQEQTVTITEDDVKALELAGIDEESLDGKTIAEIKVIAQDASKKQESNDNASQDQTNVSEEEALKAGGFAGNLIGKTSAELLEIINNQNAYIGTQNEKLSNPTVKKDDSVDSLNQQNLNTNDVDTDTENKAVDLLGLSPEEQQKQIALIIKKEVDAGIKKGLQESPELDTVREQTRKNQMTEFHTTLGDTLPEDITTPEQAKVVFEAWKTATKDKYTTAELKALAQTPNVLITLISDHYRINNKVAPKKETTTVKKDNDNTSKVVKKAETESYQRMRSMIANAPSGESKFNFKRKAVEDNESDLLSKDGTESQQMMGRILEKHLQ